MSERRSRNCFEQFLDCFFCKVFPDFDDIENDAENVAVSPSGNPPIFVSRQCVDGMQEEPEERIYDNVPVVPDVLEDYSQVMSASAGPDLFNVTPLPKKNVVYGSSEDCPTFWSTISGNVSDSAIHSEIPQRTRAVGISGYGISRGRNSYYSSAGNRDWNVVQSQLIHVTRNESMTRATIESPLCLTNDMFKEATSVPATIQHSKSLVLPPNER